MKKLAALFALTFSLTAPAQMIKTEEGFTARPVPAKIIKFISGKCYPEGALLPIGDLYYLNVKYYGFDGKTHKGEIIMHQAAAKDTLEIFKELYALKYPIEKMRLADYYNADDRESMRNNNTAGFCWRLTTDGRQISYHALGMAVDINPLYNPYVDSDIIEPPAGAPYADRNLAHKAFIEANGPVVNAFKKRGWTWGGDWKSFKDYQHFQKFTPLRREYNRKLGSAANKP
ncbi:MAG: M15 family metallopeptidase [Elusimicrobiota bacterium]|jgi:hypothetical protein|nr:M15 family metallopeptidase [Elusimicrobiota bacterium]